MKRDLLEKDGSIIVPIEGTIVLGHDDNDWNMMAIAEVAMTHQNAIQSVKDLVMGKRRGIVVPGKDHIAGGEMLEIIANGSWTEKKYQQS